VRVRCTSNLAKALPDEYLDPRAGFHREKEFGLTVGVEYVVYAVALRANQIWYYVCDDADLWYPFHYPAPLFEIVDSSLSRYWRYAFTPSHSDHLAVLAFEEWASDEYYYDRLTDRLETEVALFGRMKALMDREADPKGDEQL